MYLVVWRYEVEPAHLAEFEEAYGSEGAWARLFAEDPTYLGTELYRWVGAPAIYLTVDRWASRAAYEFFRQRRRGEYAALDARCARLTRDERCLLAGDADVLS